MSCPGHPKMRSRFVSSPASRATATAAALSSGWWVRPSARSPRASKICAPRERRVSPSASKPNRRARSSAAAYASRETSRRRSTNARRSASPSLSISASSSRRGAPRRRRTRPRARHHRAPPRPTRAGVPRPRRGARPARSARRPRRAAAPRMSAPRRALRAAHASRATASPTSPTRRSRRRRVGRLTRRAAWDARTGSSAISRLVTDPKDGEEALLLDLDRSHHLHALLAFLLLLEELSLARDVAAVALREHVLALRLHGLARDDLPADRSLDANVEHLLRDEAAELVHEHATGLLCAPPVGDDRKRVDKCSGNEDVEAHEVRRAVLRELVVERGVAARARLQLVIEIDDDLGERHVVLQHRPRRIDVAHVGEGRALGLRELHHRTHVRGRHDDRHLHPRFADLDDRARVRQERRVVDRDLGALLGYHAVLDGRRCGDEVEVVLALEALLHDLEMEKAEEPRAETEAQCLRRLRLVDERRVV